MEKFTNQKIEGNEISLNREDNIWQEHFLQLWNKGKKKEVQSFLDELYPDDVAYLIEGLPFEDAWALFKRAGKEKQGEILDSLRTSTFQKFIFEIGANKTAVILSSLATNVISHLLTKVENEELKQNIIDYLPESLQIDIIELLGYPEDSSGALMKKECAIVNLNDTIKQAISAIRKSSHKEDIHSIFVVDDDMHYKGHVSLHKLILSKSQTKIKGIMENEIMPIPVQKSQEEVAKYFTRYDFISAPIVNTYGKLLGRIAADDVLDVMQDEISKDILGMGGVVKEEPEIGLWASSFRRTVWLVLNLFTAFISTIIISSFNQTIQKSILLAALMPVVASIGGNAGAQSMALAVRNIALGETFKNAIHKAFFREVTIALINGPIVGTIAATLIYIFTQEALLSLILLAALFGNLIVASVMGTLVPYFLKRFNIDPAIGSVIIVTTFTDSMGFTIFLGIAYLFL